MSTSPVIAYVAKYKDLLDTFVGLDQSSGGYPYRTSLLHCEKWISRQKLIDYISHFPETWEIWKVTMTLKKSR